MTAIPQQVASRVLANQQVHYYRKLINFSDANISSPVNPFGKLPAGASISNVGVEIVTAFNAVTTNVLTVGITTASANEIVAAADLNAGAVGYTNVVRGRGQSLMATASQYLYAKYTQTGTAATAGQAIVTIEYIPNNDG